MQRCEFCNLLLCSSALSCRALQRSAARLLLKSLMEGSMLGMGYI